MPFIVSIKSIIAPSDLFHHLDHYTLISFIISIIVPSSLSWSYRCTFCCFSSSWSSIVWFLHHLNQLTLWCHHHLDHCASDVFHHLAISYPLISFIILTILPLDVFIPWCLSLSQSSYLLMFFSSWS